MIGYNGSVILRNDGVDPSTSKADLNAGLGVLVTVRFATVPAGAGAIASLFDINDSAIANPVTTDNFGNYFFKVAAGTYDIITKESTPNEVIEPSQAIGLTAELINDLSQAYGFPTVAAYKAFATEFPVGKIIHLLDRGSEFSFTVIAGTGTANNYNIIASDQVSQSVDLVIDDVIYVLAYGLTGDGTTDDSPVINAAIDSALNSPLFIIRRVVMPTGVYFLGASLNLFNGLVFHHEPSIVYNCGAPFFSKNTQVNSLTRLTVSGNPVIRSDNTYAGVLFRTDSMSYLNITARFDGRNVTTASLFQMSDLFAGTDAYNRIECEFRNCLNSVNGAVFIEGGTFHDFTRSLWNNNGKNFTINGKNHMFGHGTAIEKSLVTGSQVLSPLTTFIQCWLEQDELEIKSEAYGCSIVDCRTRGGTLDNTDFHLLNWIKDETIRDNYFKKHSPGLMYREGNRALRTIWANRDTGISILSINGGGPVSYGIQSVLSIVGYVVHVHAGGNPTEKTIEIGYNANFNSSLPSFVALTSFELSGSQTSTDDKYVITWSDTPSVYFDFNPSASPTFELMAKFANDEANNMIVSVGILVVGTE